MITPRPRRLAVASALGVGAAAGLACVASPAAAEPLGPGWEGEFLAPFGDDVVADGENLEVPVVFEFSGPPGSRIAELTLQLAPRRGSCPTQSYNTLLDDGIGDEDDLPPPTTPEGAVTAWWTFRVDPGCNAVYDVTVTARAELPSVAGRDTSDSVSGPLIARNVAVSLVPSPLAVSAEAAPSGAVTVHWQPPSAWSDRPPADAIGYMVQRVGDDGAPVTVADDLALDQRSVVDDDLVGMPGGDYRYRVMAKRTGADGATVTSQATEATVSVGSPPPPPTTTPVTSGAARGGGLAGNVRVGGIAPGSGRVPPPVVTEVDTGFEETLDYDEVEVGDEQAVPPVDSGFFDVADEGTPVGEGLLVPAAVGLCLAVWAGHLRHLARRAAPPLH